MRGFIVRDIHFVKDSELAELYRIFEIVEELRFMARYLQNNDIPSGKTLVTTYFRPSTRSRLTHEAAMHRLGGQVIGCII